jgi:hypothetical protein
MMLGRQRMRTRARFTGASGGGGPPTQDLYVINMLGQSEMEYILSPGSFYRNIPQPSSVPTGNVVMHTLDDSAPGNPVVTTVVSNATVTAGLVNPAMAAMAAALGYVLPSKTFHIADCAVSGTGRVDLGDDTTDPGDGRSWLDLTRVIDAAEASAGQPSDLVLECWYRSDSGFTPNFVNAFWPIYFGSNGAGANFTLGTTNAVISRQVDHCIWDAQAAPTAKGRGIHTRAGTTWSVLTPMSDIFPYPIAPAPEALNFTAVTSSMGEPRRQVITDLASNSIAQTAGITVGPSAVITRFNAPSTPGGPTHPSITDPDGQVGFMWPFFVAIARKAGLTISEPVIEGFEAAPDGSWCDVIITLPNGGNLTTKRILESRAPISSLVPHRQDVIGFEVGRAGTFRPVFNTAEVSYPANTRGTVTITDTGSGSPRKGRVRITPTTPFAFGDAIRYLAGGASAVLQTPRDIGVDADMLLETIPDLRDAAATYPFPGVAVRPLQAETFVPLPAPPFTARAAYFDGASSYSSSSISQAAGQIGFMSRWIRLDDAVWNTPTRACFDYRIGSTIVFTLTTASSGRMNLRLNNDTASDVFSFFSAPGSAPFVPGQWYHIMVSWKTDGTLANSDLTIYVNDQQVRTGTFANTLDMAFNTLTRHAEGSNAGGTQFWRGDMGHAWTEVDLASWIDLSIAANREKFALAGQPVNLGANGELVNGTSPKWYYDGLGAGYINRGTAGAVPLTGALSDPTLAPTTPQY